MRMCLSAGGWPVAASTRTPPGRADAPMYLAGNPQLRARHRTTVVEPCPVHIDGGELLAEL